MQNAKVYVTPMKLNLDILETSYPCGKPCREAIGSLLYLLVGTLPDIAFAVARMAKFIERSIIKLWNCVKWILRYSTSTHGLKLENMFEHGISPTVYVDADWASAASSCKSFSGLIAIMAGSAAMWYSR